MRQLVVDAGYTSASGVRNALSHVADDRYSLARVTVMSDTDAAAVDDVLAGVGIKVAPGRELVRTRMWRQVRRRRYRAEPATA